MKFRFSTSKALACGAAFFVLQACIHDNIPYPYIQANITSISAEGQIGSANIDSTNLVVTFRFPEDANIYSVKIDELAISPNTEVLDNALSVGKVIDLGQPYTATLRMYQDYEWTLRCVRDIERYFTVDGQIGTSEIDPESRTVSAVVTDRVPIDAVPVLTCKLGPSSSTETPSLAGEAVDFSSPVKVTIDNYGHKEEWTITISVTASTVFTVRADGWTQVAWIYGQAQEGKENYIEYRIAGDTEWLRVPESDMEFDGGDFRARIVGLTPNTAYEARAVSGQETGETLMFTTGSILQLPNSNFDDWWLNGKVWNPWLEDQTPYWDTGNKGATTLGQSNTVPTDDTVDGVGKAAMLQSKFVGVSSLGKLAAGNIFVGSYVRTDGTNGILSFGREFAERPTRLTGYMKYKDAAISSASTGFEDMKGQPDTCIIWCALIDSDEPFEIRTNPKNRQLFDPEADIVIAYGKYEIGQDVDAYVPFDITLDYKATNRIPKYILVTASASKYGDYFTGANGAVLYVDNFELKYDY
ncbi:MAG: PCMD domain-containing protein [Clostridium sp.]|nr:PCMD domain-containing protein [Clostridium sp.]